MIIFAIHFSCIRRNRRRLVLEQILSSSRRTYVNFVPDQARLTCKVHHHFPAHATRQQDDTTRSSKSIKTTHRQNGPYQADRPQDATRRHNSLPPGCFPPLSHVMSMSCRCVSLKLSHEEMETSSQPSFTTTPPSWGTGVPADGLRPSTGRTYQPSTLISSVVEGLGRFQG